MALKHVFLHIGHAKTGTSALQHFFFQNREQFKKKGILYPETGLYGPGHHKVPVGLLKQEEIKDFLTYFEKTNYNHCFCETHLYDRLITEIMESECHKIFLSSEYFMFMRNLSGLQKFLAPFDVTIVLTLRRQDLFLESFYRQMLIVDYSKGISRFIKTYRSLFLDYRNIIKKWSDVFGEKAIIVSDYGAWVKENDLYKYFTNLLNIPLDSDLIIPKDPIMLNKSMDIGFAALLRFSNRIGISEKFQGRLPGHLRGMQNNFENGYLGQGTFLSPKLRQKIFEKHFGDNRWIETTFLGGASSLTAPVTDTEQAYTYINIFKAGKVLWEAYNREKKPR